MQHMDSASTCDCDRPSDRRPGREINTTKVQMQEQAWEEAAIRPECGQNRIRDVASMLGGGGDKDVRVEMRDKKMAKDLGPQKPHQGGRTSFWKVEKSNEKS